MTTRLGCSWTIRSSNASFHAMQDSSWVPPPGGSVLNRQELFVAVTRRQPCSSAIGSSAGNQCVEWLPPTSITVVADVGRSEEHTSELQSRENLVCRLLLEKKKEE